MANYSQLENLIKERRNSSAAYSFVNSLRHKSSTIAPSFVEEGEYSNSEIAKDVQQGHERGNYGVGVLDTSDEMYHSNEVVKPTEFSLRALTAPTLLGHSNSFGRSNKRALQHENSNEENNLMDIDDRMLEQIKRAITLCDRNNTGVVSYTGMNIYI